MDDDLDPQQVQAGYGLLLWLIDERLKRMESIKACEYCAYAEWALEQGHPILRKSKWSRCLTWLLGPARRTTWHEGHVERCRDVPEGVREAVELEAGQRSRLKKLPGLISPSSDTSQRPSCERN